LDKSNQNQCSSFHLTTTDSININQEDGNQRNNDDDNQQPSSDDDEEDCFNHYTIPSPTNSTSHKHSPMIVENESTKPSTIDKSHNHPKSKKINEVRVAETPSSTQQTEHEFDALEETQIARVSVKRKRQLHQSSSPSINTTKQSTRLAAKRVRHI
jgi:hypothetical protein